MSDVMSLESLTSGPLYGTAESSYIESDDTVYSLESVISAGLLTDPIDFDLRASGYALESISLFSTEGFKDTVKNLWSRFVEWARNIGRALRNFILKIISWFKSKFGSKESKEQEKIEKVSNLLLGSPPQSNIHHKGALALPYNKPHNISNNKYNFLSDNSSKTPETNRNNNNHRQLALPAPNIDKAYNLDENERDTLKKNFMSYMKSKISSFTKSPIGGITVYYTTGTDLDYQYDKITTYDNDIKNFTNKFTSNIDAFFQKKENEKENEKGNPFEIFKHLNLDWKEADLEEYREVSDYSILYRMIKRNFSKDANEFLDALNDYVKTLTYCIDKIDNAIKVYLSKNTNNESEDTKWISNFLISSLNSAFQKSNHLIRSVSNSMLFTNIYEEFCIHKATEIELKLLKVGDRM